MPRMNHKAEKIIGALVPIFGTLLIYSFLKLTGKIPDPYGGLWNELDVFIMKFLSLLKYLVPAIIFITLIYRSWKTRKEHMKKLEEDIDEINEDLNIMNEKLIDIFERINLRFEGIDSQILLIHKSNSENELTETVEDFL